MRRRARPRWCGLQSGPEGRSSVELSIGGLCAVGAGIVKRNAALSPSLDGGVSAKSRVARTRVGWWFGPGRHRAWGCRTFAASAGSCRNGRVRGEDYHGAYVLEGYPELAGACGSAHIKDRKAGQGDTGWGVWVVLQDPRSFTRWCTPARNADLCIALSEWRACLHTI